MKFAAIYVEPTKNDTIASVLFADPETNPDEPSVLVFSRATEFADSSYYFEINDQSYGRYGGLKSVRLGRDGIKVCLEEGVVEEFANKDFAEVRVKFDIDDEMYEEVLEILKDIFAGEEIFVVE